MTNALLASNGRILVGPGSTVIGDVTTGAAGRVETGGGIIHIGNLDNSGVLSGTTDLTGTFLNRATGDVRLAAGQSMYLQSSASHTNAGLLEVIGNASSQASFEAIGSVTNTSGGTSMITARYGSLRFDGGLTNQGALSISYGTTDVFGHIANATGGTIAVAGGAGVTFYDDVVQNGTLVVSAAGSTHSSAVFFGSFSGSGGFTGGGDVFVMGDLRPGNSPAEVTYNGNLYLGPTTKTVMELGGTQPGTQADKVDVTGALGLDGALNVVLYNNFVPSPGATFDLFHASSTTGTFSSVSLPALPGMRWDTSSLYTTGSISVVPGLLGDANGDGHVDLNDLNTVLNNLGTTTSAWTSGNFDGAPTIDLNDLNDVLNNLGVTYATSSADQSVRPGTPAPEPATLALLGLTPLLTKRRKS